MSYHYFIFANQNGKNVTPEKIRKLQDIFSRGKGKLEGKFLVTQNLSQLEKSIKEHTTVFLDQEPRKTLVGIVGGDGTVMHTRTLVENIWNGQPAYAFFPEGTMNNIHRAVGLDRVDSSVKLAKHIVAATCANTLEDYIIPFPSLDVNNRKGFNVGFGLIPKLLWLYYGNSAKQYRELEEALQFCHPDQYEAKYKEVTGKKEADLFDLLSKERGLMGAVKTTLRLLNGLRRHTDEAYLLHKPLSGDIMFDGEIQTFPQPPSGVYVSCYEEVNLGLGSLNPRPSPEARTKEGKFQVAVPYGNPFSIIPDLPKVIAGEKLSHALYKHVSSLKLSEKFAQVDGELLLQKGFTVNYDGRREVITLPVTV